MFGGVLIGIIGHEFLRKNKLVLDYNKEELHHSDGKLDEDVNDYEFFFPMEFGLKKYNPNCRHRSQRQRVHSCG